MIPRRDKTVSQKRVDDLVDTYMRWRQAAANVRERYESWSSAPRSDLLTRYASYVAALDGEGHAAADYAQQVQQVAHSLRMTL
jgi:hypothetical protein